MAGRKTTLVRVCVRCGAERLAPRDDAEVALYRRLRGSAALPRVLAEAKRRGERWVSRITKGSEVELNPEAFGIVDKSDRERIQRELEGQGLFRHLKPEWAMSHTREERQDERLKSRWALEEELMALAERRVKGREAGGGTAPTLALAHEIGCLVEAMPSMRTDAEWRVDTVDGIAGALKRVYGTMTKRIQKDLRENGERQTAFDADEAARAVAWWSGVTHAAGEQVDAVQRGGERAWDEMNRQEEIETQRLKQNASGLARELVGMFLAAPETLKERCRWAYDEMLNEMDAKPETAKAYVDIVNEGAPSGVLKKVQEQWRHEAEVELRALEREIDRPLGTPWQRTKRRVLLNLHSREEPALCVVADGFADKIAAAKRRLAAANRRGDAKERQSAKDCLAKLRETAKKTIMELRIGVLRRQRGGGWRATTRMCSGR